MPRRARFKSRWNLVSSSESESEEEDRLVRLGASQLAVKVMNANRKITTMREEISKLKKFNLFLQEGENRF
jgi:hypothetical protein